MRWPWQKPEHRDSGGDFSDTVVRLIEAQAAGTAADAASTAAVEAASGALSAGLRGGGGSRGALGGGSHLTGLSRASRARPDPQRRLHARNPHGRRWHGPVDNGVELALGRLARPGDLDRARDGLRAFDKHDLEPPRVGRCILPVGRNAGAAVCRDGAAVVGAHDSPAAKRGGAKSSR